MLVSETLAPTIILPVWDILCIDVALRRPVNSLEQAWQLCANRMLRATELLANS